MATCRACGQLSDECKKLHRNCGWYFLQVMREKVADAARQGYGVNLILSILVIQCTMY